MPKKKKRRRPQQRPARPRPQGAGAAPGAPVADETGAEEEHGPSRRAERKEEARRERERRIKQARRRKRSRRLIRWGITIVVIGGIAGGVYLAGSADRKKKEDAAALAETLSCTDVEEQNAEQPNEHVEPYATGSAGVPAFGGNHNPAPLPSDPKVYTQQPPEEQAIHNLEHGYVIVYYAAEGENALDEKFVSALGDLVEGEGQVLMAPYGGLDHSVYFMAWGARQACDPPADAGAGDLATVAEVFVDEWRDGQFAPEPAAS